MKIKRRKVTTGGEKGEGGSEKGGEGERKGLHNLKKLQLDLIEQE